MFMLPREKSVPSSSTSPMMKGILAILPWSASF